MNKDGVVLNPTQLEKNEQVPFNPYNNDYNRKPNGLSEKMRKLKQFSLLLWKDWVLLRRNKIWTFFELIIPSLLLAPIVYLVVHGVSTQNSPAKEYDSFSVKGTIEDVFYEQGFMKSIYKRWCLRPNVLLGYATKNGEQFPLVDEIMRTIRQKYTDGRLTFDVKREENEEELLKVLKNDMPKSNDSYCAINKYVGGVVFDTIETSSKQLKYRILIGEAQQEKNWHLDESWENPYGETSGKGSRIPSEPPYWSTAFLSLQQSIETTFIDIVTDSKTSEPLFQFQGLPEPPYKTSSISAFINFFPTIWAFITFVNVVHITREIAAENASVKPFLTAMGLSSLMFYAAHIFIAFVKFAIVFVLTTVWLLPVMTFVSPMALILTVLLFGLGAVVFGALVASFFDNTSSAIKAIVILWGISIGIGYKLMPSIEKIGNCFVYALNINGAFTLAIEAISDYMRRERELNIFNMFADSTLHFSLGFSLFMMVFDIVWMFALTLIVDYVRTSADFSLKSFFGEREKLEDYTQVDGVTAQNTRNNEQMSAIGGASTSLPVPNNDMDLLIGSNEIDGGRDNARSDISVNRLVKIWSTTGERAVDGLTFDAKRGQVTILLGHNGAGKSTTFASIAGIIQPTHGNITICGYDVGRQTTKTREHIGLCPQYNPLYEKLTVEEHLWLIFGMKGGNEKKDFQEEMIRLLVDVQLDAKRDEVSMNLSGGMKRKLCVCMALIGESDVVLLDEPTAGMDPGARQHVQVLLEKEKANRTILLTTHYMDEAERLGDFIVIMSHGQKAASGSVQFLKQKFGTGYLLTVVMGQDVNSKKKMHNVLESVCRHFVEGASLGSDHGLQVEIVLPENNKLQFAALFKALEAIQERNFKSEHLATIPNELKSELAILVMTSFGLSLNTLEQVFITIGDKVDEKMASRQNSRLSHHARNESDVNLKPPGYDTQTSTKSSDSYRRLMNTEDRKPDKTGATKVFAQALSILRKKFLYNRRNWTQFIGQVVIPILLLFFVSSLSQLSTKNVDQSRRLTADELEPTRVIWRLNNGTESKFARDFLEIIRLTPGFALQTYSETESLMSITKGLIGEMPPGGFGMTRNSTEEVIALFNQRNYHVLPTLVSLLNRARLANGNVGNSTIETGIVVYAGVEAEHKGVPSSLIDFLLTPMLILIFAMVTSTFAMFLIEERTSMFAHQQFLTGISPLTFYLASLFYDAIIYIIICSMFLIIFLIFQWMSNHLFVIILFWALYFVACVPFVYAVSFLFESSSKANVLLIVWQVVMTGVALIFISLIALFSIDEKLREIIADTLLFILPSYAFANAIFQINIYGSYTDSADLLKWDFVGKNMAYMAIFGAFSIVLFITLNFKFVRRFLSQTLTIRRTPHVVGPSTTSDLPHCENLEKERDFVNSGVCSNYPLFVKNLTKNFGSFTALNDLSLAVNEKEVFGLLGVNGAGKTTTFNILTGQAFATSGEARIGGADVTDLISIGYCPQFDALMLDLTGRECLEILAQMHGFSNFKEKAELVLECVGMLAHGDKHVRYYSGGQKRKISVGVALLAPTRIIILDEPTAGIDPRARREVWELLKWCREHSNSALMLTSHSMDECEALCSRIAVLNKGSLIAIGSGQELKSLYGNTYTMTLTINHASERNDICQQVNKYIPNAMLKTAETNKTLNLKWQIPKEPGDRWSSKFEQVQSLAKLLNAKDFILAQSSLEETFLRLAGLDGEDQTDYNHPNHATI